MSGGTNGNSGEETRISPVEDLMREHGILHRILLIYRDILKCFRGEKSCDPNLVYAALFNAANIAKAFIEDYHQSLEETYVFPLFQQDLQYSDLINTLLQQHYTARCLTAKILKLLTCPYANSAARPYQLTELLSLYIDMYEPHSAREDTVVFPAFHNKVPESNFTQLGETFEEIEEQKFGENGFESVVRQVSGIEQALGIYDLDRFTPSCSL